MRRTDLWEVWRFSQAKFCKKCFKIKYFCFQENLQKNFSNSQKSPKIPSVYLSKIFIVSELFLNFSKNILFRFKICKKCNADADTQNWSCTGTATLRVIPHQPELITEKISRRIQHMFNHKENDWGFSHFLSWDDATDPAKGYCTPEISLTLEATVI